MLHSEGGEFVSVGKSAEIHVSVGDRQAECDQPETREEPRVAPSLPPRYPGQVVSLQSQYKLPFQESNQRRVAQAQKQPIRIPKFPDLTSSMARGNQRDKAREKNLKEAAAKVYPHHRISYLSLSDTPLTFLPPLEKRQQRKIVKFLIRAPELLISFSIQMSGSELARRNEATAKLMKEKQAKGRHHLSPQVG